VVVARARRMRAVPGTAICREEHEGTKQTENGKYGQLLRFKWKWASDGNRIAGFQPV
jgi:hypothetical protein